MTEYERILRAGRHFFISCRDRSQDDRGHVIADHETILEREIDGQNPNKTHAKVGFARDRESSDFYGFMLVCGVF